MTDTNNTKSADLIPIKSTTRTIQDCFRSCLYSVPNFQRPYSWDIDELNDYWNDVVLAKGDLFFGATVTWESESRELFNNTYSIIDGQQRLTTSAIALSAVRDHFKQLLKQLNENRQHLAPTDLPQIASRVESQIVNTQRYLIAVDDDGVEYPVIERNEPNFREVVQKPSRIPSGAEWNGSARQIGVARQFFESKIQTLVQEDPPEDYLEKLKTIRNNILKARVIQVELTSEEDGFLIFETLNTRGADLRLADLVKNLLVRGGAKNDLDRKTIAERWERMVNKVQDIARNADAVDQFIWQSWNSRRKAVTEAELYKKISELVGNDDSKHIQFLDELEFDANIYQYLENPIFVINKKSLSNNSALRIPEVADAFRALGIFNVSVANSALIAIVRKYEQTALLKRKDLIDACCAIENFHFQFTALLNSSSTGGTRGRYNRFAVELEQTSTATATRAAVRNFKAKLTSSLPASDDAKTAFTHLFYAPRIRLTNAQKRRSRKLFIAYVLLKFAHNHNCVPAGQDFDSWSIEHIRPQSLADGDITNAEFSIGNLTLLTSQANGDLGDGSFEDKREGLVQYALWKDGHLERWLSDQARHEITQKDIAGRARHLADLAVSRVWSIR